MMRRGKSLKPGLLQDLIQHHLTVYSVPQAVKDNLCKFRIAASRERMRLKDIAKVNEKITAGWDFKGKQHLVLYIMYDNLGFRVLGARVGYEQYTMVLVQRIDQDKLRKLGFYLPVGSVERPISRKRSEWSEVREDVDKKDIPPTEDDYNILGTQILAHIETLMVMCNDIPTVEEARTHLKEHG
jgi:hypothetical protein